MGGRTMDGRTNKDDYHGHHQVNLIFFDFFWNFLGFPSYGANFSFVASFLKFLEFTPKPFNLHEKAQPE